MIFIWLVIAVFVVAIRQLIEMVRRSGPTSVRSRLFRWVVLGLAAAGCVCIAYGYFVEPYRVEVTRIPIATKKLPAGGQPIRILQVSDLHCDLVERAEPRVLELARLEHPDLIVFTGDALNTPEALPRFRQFVTGLAAIAPTYAVRGNWDVWYWTKQNLFDGTGAIELTGEPVPVTVHGERIWLFGAPYEQEAILPRSLPQVGNDQFRIVCFHTPDLILDLAPL